MPAACRNASVSRCSTYCYTAEHKDSVPTRHQQHRAVDILLTLCCQSQSTKAYGLLFPRLIGARLLRRPPPQSSSGSVLGIQEPTVTDPNGLRVVPPSPSPSGTKSTHPISNQRFALLLEQNQIQSSPFPISSPSLELHEYRESISQYIFDFESQTETLTTQRKTLNTTVIPTAQASHQLPAATTSFVDAIEHSNIKCDHCLRRNTARDKLLEATIQFHCCGTRPMRTEGDC